MRAHYILFCEIREPEKERWVGKRVGIEGAKALLGADDAYSIHEVDKIMPELLTGKQEILYSLGCTKAWDQRLLEWVGALKAKIKNWARSADKMDGSFAVD